MDIPPLSDTCMRPHLNMLMYVHSSPSAAVPVVAAGSTVAVGTARQPCRTLFFWGVGFRDWGFKV